jgi:hypothetical protein
VDIGIRFLKVRISKKFNRIFKTYLIVVKTALEFQVPFGTWFQTYTSVIFAVVFTLSSLGGSRGTSGTCNHGLWKGWGRGDSQIPDSTLV